MTPSRNSHAPRLAGPGTVYQGCLQALDPQAADARCLAKTGPVWSAGAASPPLAGAIVLVRTPLGAIPLRHYRYHSFSGFEWGYRGSGPADLARCILLHYFAVTPSRQGEIYPPLSGELPVRYYDFMTQIIASLPRRLPWSLTAPQLSAWIAAHS